MKVAEESTQKVVGTGCLAQANLPPIVKNWTNEHWKTFSAIDIVDTVSKQLSARINAFAYNMDYFVYCDVYRRRIQALTAQKELLTNRRELDPVQKIAEMSYIKTLFKKQSALNELRMFTWMFIPLAPLFKYPRKESQSLRMRHQGLRDRATFENRPGELPLISSLKNYADPVQAHNDLLKTNPYLMPYIP